MAPFNVHGGSILNFRDRSLMVPSTVIVVSLLVLVGALLFGVFAPLPNVAGLAKTQKQIDDIDRQIAMLKTQQQQAAETVSQRVWQGSENDVSAAVLAKLTALAKQNGLALSSFRPQRTTDLAGISDMPFTVQLSGPYPGVRVLMRQLDGPHSRVVLHSTQITSASNSTTGVTATLGVSAYIVTNQAILAASNPSPGSTTPRVASMTRNRTFRRGARANAR